MHSRGYSAWYRQSQIDSIIEAIMRNSECRILIVAADVKSAKELIGDIRKRIAKMELAFTGALDIKNFKTGEVIKECKKNS